ncbi:MAG: ABC transporter ATP-binding protein [Candidatus Bathyarchaeia archaeon]
MELVLRATNLKGGYLLNPAYATASQHELYVDAVSGVSLDLFRDEIFGIAGESGCGKSTFTKIIYGYLEPPLILKDGAVHLYTKKGKVFPITSLSREQLKKDVFWKHVSYIPQSSMNVLNPTMRIRDHFAEMFKLHANMDKTEAYEEAKKYLEQMGLPKDVLSAFPHQLSGGMRQRVVISLALIMRPDLILADEPTSALDVINQQTVLSMLKDAQESFKNTVVIVSHDMGVHGVITHRIAVMYAGRIVEVGRTEEVFEDPLHPYTQALIKALPRLGDKTQRKGLSGHPPDLRNPPPGCRFGPRCPFSGQQCKEESPTLREVKPGRFVECWLYYT